MLEKFCYFYCSQFRQAMATAYIYTKKQLNENCGNNNDVYNCTYNCGNCAN